MDLLGIGIVGAAVAASFLYALWPLIKPPAEGALPPGEENGAEPSGREISQLFIERDRAYRDIREIEFDREMGKLSEEDFAQMIAPARAKALEVLRRLEARGVREGMVAVQLSEREAAEAADRVVASASRAEAPPAAAPRQRTLDERLEEEILRYRKARRPPAGEAAAAPSRRGAEAPPPVRFCPSCGARAGEGHNFCSACGFQLK